MNTWRILGFGFLLTFVSSFGQTFFIGQFKELLLEAIPNLTHGSYGQWYSVATLSSAVCLAYLGRRIDDLDLRFYTVAVCVGLAVACVAISQATSLLILVPAIFGLRLFGQGLLGHIANTATARYLDKARGRALSIVNLGHPAGEALLPVIVVPFLVTDAWRGFWIACAGVVIVAVIPTVFAFLRGHREHHAAWQDSVEKAADIDPEARQWTAREVLFDLAFWRCVPAFLALPFFATGFLFHQDVLKASYVWGAEAFAFSFSMYSIAQVLSAPLIGIWVDRSGAGRLLPILTLPLASVLTLLAFLEGTWLAFVWMAGMGLSSGIAFSVVSSVLVERYGATHLGAIRSQLSVMMVISTALSPPLFGALIDREVTMPTIVGGSAIACVVAAGLAAIPKR